MFRRLPRACTCALFVAVAAASGACSGSGLSKEAAKPLVALSLANDSKLHLAAYTGSFCESDEGRRLRLHPTREVVPSNAHAFGLMADNALVKKLIVEGYVTRKDETLPPDEGEASHPACGRREVCAKCPVISRYYVATYELTPKGKDLFLVTPVTEEDFTTLYNTGPLTGPLDDVQQAFSDDMPLRISVVVATKAFDVMNVATDATKKTARVDFDWYWKPATGVNTQLAQQLIPRGRNHATVDLKQLEDGWHLQRDATAPLE